MRRSRGIVVGLLALLLIAGPRLAAADGKQAFRIAFIGPLSGPTGSGGDSLAGLHMAAEWRSARGGVLGHRVAVVTYDDKDDPAALEREFASALSEKVDAIVAAPTGKTVEALVAKARKQRGSVPVILVGSAGPRPTTDPKDPVLFLGSWPVDQAIQVVNALELPCAARAPGFVVEDTARGRELEEAIHRNLGPHRKDTGTVRVPPGGSPTAEGGLAALKTAGCDRIVIVGEPDLLEATFTTTSAMAWDVPFLGTEGLLARGASGMAMPGLRAHFLVGSPQLTMDGAPRPLTEAHDLASQGKAGAVLPRTVAAWTATLLLCDAAESPPDVATAGPGANKPRKQGDLLAAVRRLRYGPSESSMPLFDLTGRASLYRWTVWMQGSAGPEPVESGFLPAEGFGPLMGLRQASLFKAQPGTKVVWLTYGDEKSKPVRTIDKDLSELGLSTRGYEGSLDGFVLDELLARTMGKLNRLYLRNEDGTSIPGVSFNISFTAEKPVDLKPTEYWTVLLGGDDPETGGRAFTGEGRAVLYATYLRRTIFQPNALVPRVDHEDLAFVNGTQPWKGVKIEHLRADRIRCLIDGYAGSFALTGAHEIGHLAGLQHDATDPRSIMNVTEGVGLRETQAFFIPAHAEILEKLLGRAKEPKK